MKNILSKFNKTFLAALVCLTLFLGVTYVIYLLCGENVVIGYVCYNVLVVVWLFWEMTKSLTVKS